MNIFILSSDDKTIRFLKQALGTYEKHKYFQITITVYRSVKTYFTATEKPDMFFIDDGLEHRTCVETARLVRSRDSKASVVLLSNNSERVFDAFPVKPHRYFLKPLTQSEVFEALDAYRKDFITYRIIIVKIDDTFRVFSSEEIIAVVGEGSKTNLMTKTETLELQTPFSQVESQLPEEYFYKPHRAYIINMKHIANFTPEELVMVNKAAIPISRRKKLDFFVRYSEFVKGHTFTD